MAAMKSRLSMIAEAKYGTQGSARDQRAGARLPGMADMCLEELRGDVAHEFEGIAPLDERDALRGEAFEADRKRSGRLIVLAAARVLSVGIDAKRLDARPDMAASEQFAESATNPCTP
ncbi:MAG: hypothetical protein R3C54_01795 [Parvularculaceae bacterium]